MRRELEIYSTDDGLIRIILEINLNLRKENLRVNERRELEEFKYLASEIKNIKDFVSLSQGYSQLDWYSETSPYGVPYFYCGSDKKVEAGYCNCATIPKEWAKAITLTLENPSSIRGINKYLELLDIRVSETVKDKIKEKMREPGYYSINI